MAKRITKPKEEVSITLNPGFPNQEELDNFKQLVVNSSTSGIFFGEVEKLNEGIDIQNEDIEDGEIGENIDQLKIIAEHAEVLVRQLDGIFIGGHAAQTRDMLYEALAKYKNGN